MKVFEHCIVKEQGVDEEAPLCLDPTTFSMHGWILTGGKYSGTFYNCFITRKEKFADKLHWQVQALCWLSIV